jgi:tetratricopeptide (TPR) repeat protein
MPDRTLRVFLILIFAGLSYIQTATAQGIKSSDSLNSLLQTINEPNKKVDIILEYLEKPENQFMENAVDFANRAYQIAQQADYIAGKIRSMLILGNYYFRNSEYKNAMEYAQKSKTLAEDLNLDLELANSLNLIGIIYTELGDNDRSSQYFFKSLEMFENLKDMEGISRSLGNIGLNFYGQQEYKKALEYYNRSLDIAKSIDNQNVIKKQYNNIAIVFVDQQKYDSANIFLKKALAISIQLGDKLGQAINMLNIGYDQMNQGKYDEAITSFQQALELATELNNRSHISECYLNFAFCYYSTNRIDESIDYFKKALLEGQTQGYYTITHTASKMLNQIYAGKKDILNAYKYSLLENVAEDSLVAFRKHRLISKLEFQYVYEKMEFERQLAQQAKSNIMVLIIFSLISGLVILMFIFSRLRLKSKLIVVEKEKIQLEKDKIKSELIIKDKELTVNLISLIKKNEMLSEISDKLVQLENHTNGKETKDAIAKISQKLRHGTHDKMLNEFTQRFQEVHAGFYEKLLVSYPELTLNELKLCAFLRLNMSTKDIAELTGQQPLTINKARYRLRQKLTLSGSDANLVLFLSQI